MSKGELTAAESNDQAAENEELASVCETRDTQHQGCSQRCIDDDVSRFFPEKRKIKQFARKVEIIKSY